MFGDGVRAIRRMGTPHGCRLPPSVNITLCCLRKAVAAWPVALDDLLAAVVLTVSVADTAVVPVMAVAQRRSTQVDRPQLLDRLRYRLFRLKLPSYCSRKARIKRQQTTPDLGIDLTLYGNRRRKRASGFS